MANPPLRNCRISDFADTPHSVILADQTLDTIDPLDATSRRRHGIAPVAHRSLTPDGAFVRLAAKS